MKRKVERKKKLPSFAITIEELENLWEKLHSLFDSNNTEKLYTSIDIKLPSESLSFDSVNELKEYKKLPDEIKNFSLCLWKNGKRISINSYGFSLSPTEYNIYTSAEDEAWCAGAIETAYSFLSSHKRWYNWLNSAPIGCILYILTAIAVLPTFYNPSVLPITLSKQIVSVTENVLLMKTIASCWLISFIFIACLYLFKSKLFPVGVLQIKNDENVLHKYFTEITIGIAVLTLVVTVIGIVK